MKTIFYSLILTGLLFTSCGDDETTASNCAASWTIEYSDELNAVLAASNAWGMNMTQENCDALNAAYAAYINALRDWEDCADALNLTDSWEAAVLMIEQESALILC